MMDPAAHARAQCCYSTAYFVLPNYAFTAADRLLDMFGGDPISITESTDDNVFTSPNFPS